MARCKWCHAKSQVYERLSSEAKLYNKTHLVNRVQKLTTAQSSTFTKWGPQVKAHLDSILVLNKVEVIKAILRDNSTGVEETLFITIPSPKSNTEEQLLLGAVASIKQAFIANYG